jgi:UDP-galactopyranose mutase
VKTLVVGAGFSGATIAQQLHEDGQDVTVVDRRLRIGGTAHDFEAGGVRVSSHGAHLFHTNAQHVADYLGRFTEWTPFEHRVLAVAADGQLVPIPINRTTVNLLFGLKLQTDEEVEDFFAAERETGDGSNGETQVTARVGRRLFDLLYRDYTQKQWGRPARELSSYVTGRLPLRSNDDDRYFTDDFQAQPASGWTPVFKRMLDGIKVELGVEAVAPFPDYERVIYTGPVDEFFNYRLGRLPFRSVRFEHNVMPGGLRQLTGVVNYCGDQPFTRTIEWRHLTGQDAPFTVITTEYPEADGDPHYPIPCPESWALHTDYRRLAATEPGVIFAGRLGTYRYMTIDQTVAQALKLARGLRESSAFSQR